MLEHKQGVLIQLSLQFRRLILDEPADVVRRNCNVAGSQNDALRQLGGLGKGQDA